MLARSPAWGWEGSSWAPACGCSARPSRTRSLPAGGQTVHFTTVVWRFLVPANFCKHRGGMGALEKWSCMPCSIYTMTVASVHMSYDVWLSKDAIYRLVEYKCHIPSGWVQLPYTVWLSTNAIYRLVEYKFHIPSGWVQMPYTIWLSTNAIYHIAAGK